VNITLHQATEQVREVLSQIDPETGEMPEGFEPARALVEKKATAVTAYILESERAADSAEEYAKELLARVKAQRKRGEWLRRYLSEHMKASGVMSIKDERGIFSASLAVDRDESIEVFDGAQIPSDYMREIPAKYEPDKTLIKKAIKDGFEVAGARLVKKDRLTIK
jgi:hypothetical protein